MLNLFLKDNRLKLFNILIFFEEKLSEKSAPSTRIRHSSMQLRQCNNSPTTFQSKTNEHI